MTIIPAKPRIKENDVKRAITDYLTAHNVFWWRANTGAVMSDYCGKKRFFRFGYKGMGDILGLHRYRFFSIECKAPGKKPTEDQLEWIERIHSQGQLAWWFDNIDNFISWWIDHFERG